MNLAKTSGLSAALLSLAVLSIITSPLIAAAEDDSGWYIGGNIGQSRMNIDDAKITSSLLGSGITTTGISKDDTSFGYKGFGGYQFNPYFSLEGGYFDLGKFGYTATTAAPNAGTVSGNLELRGFNVDLVGSFPLTESLAILGRFGGAYGKTQVNYTTTGALVASNPNPTQKDWNYKFGTGLQYDINPSFGLRLEAERYRITDAVGNHGDIDLFSAGLVYRFGEESAKPKPSDVAVAPKLVHLIKVAFSTDTLFLFDSIVINPEGKKDLDELAEKLKHTNFDMIFVVGYTDRIGANDFNIELSASRAEQVKAYLVDMAGIPASKIEAKGVGATNPVTGPRACKGQVTEHTPAATIKRLKACLAPDRRVEIDVAATEKRK